MRPIGGAIERALRKLGLDRDVARVSAIDAWPAAAREVLGEDAGVTRAVGLSDRALVVSVPDAAWSGEIRLREGDLIRAIARHAVTDIDHIRAVPAAPGRGRDR
ncbi:MAG: Dna[CI] antecedent, DciA [Chloroflexota bacterium]|nr:Dna[CI] antecedent, DciA [Chloroflexota bacterium]